MNSRQQTPNNSQERNNEAPASIAAADPRNAPQIVPAGQWLRMMTGFKAPFGHDGMPTVWG